MTIVRIVRHASRRRAVLLAVLAGCALMSSAPAASAIDLSGTITVRETSKSYHGKSRDVTVTWYLGGPVDRAYGRVSARPSVAAFADRWVRTLADGSQTCSTSRFIGFVSGADNPIENSMAFTMPSMNRLSRVSRATLSFHETNLGPASRVWSGTCDGHGEEAQWSLMRDGHIEISSQPYVVIGEGQLTMERADGTRIMAASGYLSPPRLRFTLRNGTWRATGTATRTGTYDAAIFGQGTKTVVVSWNLRSTRPSSHCTLPPRRLVRGRTPAQVGAVLRRAGLRLGRRVYDLGTRSVPAGRVTSVGGAATGTGGQRCGTRVSYWVRPA